MADPTAAAEPLLSHARSAPLDAPLDAPLQPVLSETRQYAGLFVCCEQERGRCHDHSKPTFRKCANRMKSARRHWRSLGAGRARRADGAQGQPKASLTELQRSLGVLGLWLQDRRVGGSGWHSEADPIGCPPGADVCGYLLGF
ncbi:hypothetical protein L1887_48603 [Cichorium endivia]|nr:hypothetical protein L1887_48603 [Cichorium endivia]